MSPQNQLAEALRLASAGHADAAQALLEPLVRSNPGFVDARLTLGRLYRVAGRTQDALSQFRRGAEASGGHPQAWGIYISALAESGKKSRAKKAAQSAPVSPVVRKELLALARGDAGDAGRGDAAAPVVAEVAALIRDGKLPEARARADAVLADQPEIAAMWRLRGVIALAMDDPSGAETFLRRALALTPSSDDAIANLGLSLLRQSRAMEAIGLLEPLARKETSTLEVRANLAAAYAQVGLADQALELTKDLLAAAPDDVDHIAIHADALIASGRPQDAVEFMSRSGAPAPPDVYATALAEADGIEAAVEFLASLPPQDPGMRLSIATVEAEWGRVDAATNRARQVAVERPDDPRAVRAIGLFSTWEAGDPLIDLMRAESERTDVDASHRGRFGKALAKALGDIGEHEAAFSTLSTANAALRSQLSYDPQSMSDSLSAIAETWDQATIDRLSRAGSGKVAPIFIIGLPRSGSTLIENALSRHSEVAAFGEWPVCGGIAQQYRDSAQAASIRAITKDTVSLMLTKAQGKLRFTDKLLSNFMVAGVLAAAFPRARFVEAARDLRATCLSMFENPLNAAGHPYALDLVELGRFAADYTRLVAHWEDVLGPRFHRCSYDDLVTAPGDTIRSLLDAVDLPFEPACLEPEKSARRVNTFSVAQVRKPIYATSSDRWRRYQTQLSPLIETLEKYGIDASDGP